MRRIVSHPTIYSPRNGLFIPGGVEGRRILVVSKQNLTDSPKRLCSIQVTPLMGGQFFLWPHLYTLLATSDSKKFVYSVKSHWPLLLLHLFDTNLKSHFIDSGNKTERNGTERNRTEQNRTEQNRKKQSKASKEKQAKQNKNQNKAKQKIS